MSVKLTSLNRENTPKQQVLGHNSLDQHGTTVKEEATGAEHSAQKEKQPPSEIKTQNAETSLPFSVDSLFQE